MLLIRGAVTIDVADFLDRPSLVAEVLDLLNGNDGSLDAMQMIEELRGEQRG